MREKRVLPLSLVMLILITVSSVGSAPASCKIEPPILTISSPVDNATYNTFDVPLNVSVHITRFLFHTYEIVWSLSYSIDGQPAISMSNNFTEYLSFGYDFSAKDNLTLTEGKHDVTVFLETRLDGPHYFSETVNFTVDTTKPSTTLSSTVPPIEMPLSAATFWAATASAIAIVSGVALLFLIRKRNLKKTPQPASNPNQTQTPKQSILQSLEEE